VADIGAAASVIGALGIGSVIGQYAAAGGQRRQARADVLRTLSVVENERWASELVETPFSIAVREFETAALLARVPRPAVAQYVVFAHAARWLSVDSLEAYPDQEHGGGIPSAYADVVRRSAALITELIWFPHVRRIGMKRRLRQVEHSADAIADKDVQRTLGRARNHFSGAVGSAS
jgi:hypothetical protein